MMPYAWTDPDVFAMHDGVTVYHVYQNDMIEDGPRQFIYGYDGSCSDSGDFTFDVRDLARMLGMTAGENRADHRRIIREAVSRGILTRDGVVRK